MKFIYPVEATCGVSIDAHSEDDEARHLGDMYFEPVLVPLNVQLQVFDLEAAVGPGLLVVVDLQSVCIASEGNCLRTRCTGSGNACLIGLLSDDFGRVRKGTPDDVMNLDSVSGLELRVDPPKEGACILALMLMWSDFKLWIGQGRPLLGWSIYV
ncbi:hypothetical protein Nepgr_014827 [Nepenthes gracilis]|uniref:Uncharacterized protein n=1 Tax=Nepenthes gracilis TaxID=150966 RepID=A0AAD3SMJ1_NEPGR|nr:hypothetical protein Nepgr_014827 [Nepenthes gracilis]